MRTPYRLIQLCLVTINVCNETLRSASNMRIPRFNTVTYGKRSITYNTNHCYGIVYLKRWTTLRHCLNSNKMLSYGMELGVIVNSVYRAKLIPNNFHLHIYNMYLSGTWLRCDYFRFYLIKYRWVFCSFGRNVYYDNDSLFTIFVVIMNHMFTYNYTPYMFLCK